MSYVCTGHQKAPYSDIDPYHIHLLTCVISNLMRSYFKETQDTVKNHQSKAVDAVHHQKWQQKHHKSGPENLCTLFEVFWCHMLILRKKKN